MKQPIEVRVTGGAGYIRYGDEATVAATHEIIASASVAADLSASGDVVGIEILDVFEPSQVAAAREYARTHGLAFPRDLAGALGVG